MNRLVCVVAGVWLIGGPAAPPAVYGAGQQPPAGAGAGPPGGAEEGTDTQPALATDSGAAVAFDPALLVGPPEPPWLFGPPAPEFEELGAGLYLMTVSDGNRVARVTSEGVVVAGELTPAVESAVALVDGITDRPIRYFIETHRHGNESARLPAAWRNARLVALGQQEPVPGDAVEEPARPPDLTFTRGLSVFFGEAEVQVRHFAPAHTGNDAVVLFPDLGVLYVGDLVDRELPFIDYEAGGSSRGWVRTLDGILALDFATAIPGSGPPLTKRDVQVFRDRLVTLRMRAMQLLHRGVTHDEARDLLHTTDLDWTLDPDSRFATRSFAALHAELAVERKEAREAAAAEAEEAADATAAPPVGRR